MTLKIAMILTNGFNPDIRVYKEAITLVGEGHDVEILCWDREGRHADKETEELDGIKVRRFFSKGRYGSGYKQLSGFIEFGRSVGRHIRSNSFDAIHCHDLDAFMIGNRINKSKNYRLVFDEHDFFYLYFKNRKDLINRIMAAFVITVQKMILKNADAHIVVTPKMKQHYGNNENITIITNAPMKGSFSGIAKKEDATGSITVGYLGTVRYFEELKTLIDAALKYNKIKILIAGRGVVLEKIKKYKQDIGAQNTQIIEEYKMDEIEELYSQIDITYLIYPCEDSIVSLPNKFFESIITETPIISNRVSEYGELVDNLDIGWAIDDKNLAASLDKIFGEICSEEALLEKYKGNMRRIKDQYYWESNNERLCEIYK
jgi:glycosyltransferase involved in cell wall biosynthesis